MGIPSKVMGSNPIICPKYGAISSVGRTSDCGSEGHEFESHIAPKNKVSKNEKN